MLEVLDLLRRIDADPGLELLLAPVRSQSRDIQRAPIGKFRFEQRAQSRKIEHLLARQSQRFGALPVFELQGKNAHADQVRAMNPLEGYRDYHVHAEQIRSLR